MDDLLELVKANLIIEHDLDDSLIKQYITAALSYATSYQHLDSNYYKENVMPDSTKQAIVMLASHFYESRDGSTAGYFNSDTSAANQVWESVHRLLRLDREWKV